ncbi:MAG TPA: hypothetical protein VKU01_25380 [Bryobacteraceae bacterium]|nr:hypothetical protein [Bryobacteraceae bacterium]
MSISPLLGLSTGLIQSLTSLYSGNSTANTNSTSSTSTTQDKNQLSPFAQVLSELQQLQQTDPTKYQQVTAQIATNLQSAAVTATSNGNTNAANSLNELASDFSTASQTGQPVNFQNVAQAVHGHHHGGGHHHHGGASFQTDPTQTDPTQSGSSQTSSLNPITIISNTLTNAGL